MKFYDPRTHRLEPRGTADLVHEQEQQRMQIRPLGHRIVVIPDRPVEQTASGFIIPEAYADTPPMSGIVQRLGDGPYRDKRLRTAAIARCLSILDEADIESATAVEALRIARDEMQRYLAEAGELESVCRVGDRVVFPMEAGHEVVLNEDADGTLLILNEDSVLAVYEQNAVAA